MKIIENLTGKIDLLITDVMMPNISGPELAGKLRELYPEIRTMFVTGFAGDLFHEHKLRIEDSCVLQKPFRQSQLLEKVREALNKSETIAHHSS